MAQIYASRLTENRAVTPEGYLLCIAVPVARLGEMEYSAEETGDGLPLIAVNTAPVLFSDETCSSFNGKPVTIQHPEAASQDFDVTPDNWKTVAVGIVQNTRAGQGVDADKLVADLLITDRAGIDAVNNGLIELSCGYDAEYGERDENNRAIRNKIIGNHVALVDQGRAGSDVAIRDSKPKEVETVKKETWLQKLKKIIDEAPAEAVADEEAAEVVADEDPLAAVMARLDALEAAIADLTKEPEAEKEVADDEAMDAEEEVTISDAEVLSAGIKDGKDLARRALKAADQKLVSQVCDSVEDLKGKELKTAFKAVVALQKMQRARDVKTEMATIVKSTVTIDSINKRNAEFNAARKGV